MAESATGGDSSKNDLDLDKFAIILNGDDTICASQGEEALKWRFIFDCPDTLQRLMENPVVKNAKLVYKSGKSPCIRKENSVQNFRKEFGELLKCHADTVQIHRAIIPEEGAKLFLGTLNATDLFQRKLVFAYKVETTLFICGTKEYMGETIEHVNKIQDFVLLINSQTSKIAVDDIPVKLMRKYINMYMLAKTSKLRLELDEGAKVLAVTGLKNAVVREKAKLEQMLQSITTRKCEPVTCISHLSFFEASEVAQHIEEILKKQNLVCSWETNEKECCIVVTAFDIETCEKAVKMIDTACVLDSKTLKIDDSTWIIPSDSWQEEAHSICTKLGGKVKLWLDMGKDEVVYVNTHDIKDKVKNEVEGLFDRWNRKKYLSVEKRVFDQLTVHGKQKLRQLETKYSVAIDISKNIENMGFIITGKDVKIQSVLEELNSEGRIILKSSLKLSKQWFSSKDVEVVLVPGSEDSEIIILKDKSLLHCNQSNQGELRVKETNTEIIEIIPVFSLKISRPEDIKADLVLPIDKSVRPLTFSCPQWNEGQSEDKQILSSVLHHLFEFISSEGGEAVLEIRDTKIGSWDVRTFIKWMLFTYKDHVKTKLKTAVSRLFLLTKDEEIWNVVKSVVHDAYLEKKPLVKESQMSRSRKGLVFKRIRVKVQKGQLHEAQAEVLVNTVDRSLDLTKGVISSSLLDKAGNGIQRELQQYQGNVGFGDILKTGVGTLPKPCMAIFHGVLYAYQGHSDSVKVFQDFLARCLEDANKKYRSIAFPPIGTGKLCYPKDLVASLMFQSVAKFKEAHPTSKLEEVIFAIYEKDQETFKTCPLGLTWEKYYVLSVAKFEKAHPTSKLEEVIFVIYEKDQEKLKIFEELYRRCIDLNIPMTSEKVPTPSIETASTYLEMIGDASNTSMKKSDTMQERSQQFKTMAGKETRARCSESQSLNILTGSFDIIVYIECKIEVAEDVLNSIKITYGPQGIDSLISDLDQLAKVDTHKDRILVFCDYKDAENVQKCVKNYYNKAKEERKMKEENKHLIHGGNENLKEWLQFAYGHTSWIKNLQLEGGKLYLTGTSQMKREVEKAVHSMNYWYKEEFTLSSEEQQKADEVVAVIKSELPTIFIKQTKEIMIVLSDNRDNFERACFKVKVALGRIKITARGRRHRDTLSYGESYSGLSKNDKMDAEPY